MVLIGTLDNAMEDIKIDNRRNKFRKININRAKSRETPRKSQTLNHEIVESSSEEEDLELLQNLDKLIKQKNANLTTYTQEISFKENLLEFEDTLTSDDRKRNYKKQTYMKRMNKKIKKREEKIKQHTIELIKAGDLNGLITLFDNCVRNNCEIEVDTDVKVKIFNENLDKNNNTPLHLASFYEQQNILKYLLENNANPCNKNIKQQTPYAITQNEEIRLIFKKFAQNNPNKYNYNKAQIPLPTLSFEEIAEKKKQKQKLKKERDKLKKKEKQLKVEEDVEKQKFLQLSDLEKVC